MKGSNLTYIFHLSTVEYKGRMAITEDVENGGGRGLEAAKEPLIQKEKIVTYGSKESSNQGSLTMVLLSTLVAVCGSFEFGSCVSIHLISTSAILSINMLHWH